METATSRPRRALAATIVTLGLAIAGCGGQVGVTASRGDRVQRANVPAERSATVDGFGWLQPGPAPAGWRAATIPSGAAMSYPPRWQRIGGDAGTATAVLLNGQRRIIGYLNLTPSQGRETLSNWGRFRVDHNADEGDRSIWRLDTGNRLRFRSGGGSCVRDSYTTGSGSRYVEIACIVAGRRHTTVIVGASSPQTWRLISPMLERAISGFTT